MTKWLMDLIFAFIDGAFLLLVTAGLDVLFGWDHSGTYWSIYWYMVWAAWFAKGSLVYPKNA